MFSQSAAAASGNIEAEIALAVAETNQAYENSGINQRIRLAGARQLTYPETGDLCEDVDIFKAMPAVRAYRDAIGATAWF
jgi:hypothetical protein